MANTGICLTPREQRLHLFVPMEGQTEAVGCCCAAQPALVHCGLFGATEVCVVLPHSPSPHLLRIVFSVWSTLSHSWRFKTLWKEQSVPRSLKINKPKLQHPHYKSTSSAHTCASFSTDALGHVCCLPAITAMWQHHGKEFLFNPCTKQSFCMANPLILSLVLEAKSWRKLFCCLYLLLHWISV